MSELSDRIDNFCRSEGIDVPILMAPMAGACPGGMGACGALTLSPDAIGDWARDLRNATNGAFQMNLWIPDPDPVRDAAQEAEVRAFLGQFGPEVPAEDAEAPLGDFHAQC